LARSSSEAAGAPGGAWLDRVALGGLGLGLSLYVLPFWPEGALKYGFWITLASTLLHIYTSHRQNP
jgi:hypothetical protein